MAIEIGPPEVTDDDGPRVGEPFQPGKHPLPERGVGLVVVGVAGARGPAVGGRLEPGLELGPVGFALEVTRSGRQQRQMVHLVPGGVHDGLGPPARRGGRQLRGSLLAPHRSVYDDVRRQRPQGEPHDGGLLLPERREYVVVVGAEGGLTVPNQQDLAHQSPMSARQRPSK